MIRILLFLTIMFALPAPDCHGRWFGVAEHAAPVLNTPEFAAIFGGRDGQTLKRDSCGQVRELEFVALPGTVFTILAELKRGAATIYEVASDEYSAPAGIRLYLDSRFLKVQENPPRPRSPVLPEAGQIVRKLREAIGSSYVWGGNVREGVPELAQWFYRRIGDGQLAGLTLSGLDCSGLLYQASGGWTPRNTTQLVRYGRGVAVAGKKAPEILALLEPLDLIVWNGHVVIVLDRQTAIESRLECGKVGHGGVTATPLARRLREIMASRKPLDAWPDGRQGRDIFVVRRWY